MNKPIKKKTKNNLKIAWLSSFNLKTTWASKEKEKNCKKKAY